MTPQERSTLASALRALEATVKEVGRNCPGFDARVLVDCQQAAEDIAKLLKGIGQ